MSEERRYLWFGPHAGLWPSFRMEHRLAQALVRGGRPVVMVHCFGVLSSYCPVMSADRRTVDSPRRDKERTCVDCRHATAIANERALYPTLPLDDFIDVGIRERAAGIVASTTPENWQDVEWDGIPVGRYAGYLTLLHHKVPVVTATPESWREYLSDLRNALHVAMAMPAILDRVRPTHAVVYNPLYPTNRMFAVLAERAGAQLVGLHSGSYIPARTETVGVYPHISASQTLVHSSALARSMTIPATPQEVAAVGRHLADLTTGNDPWVYSTGARREAPEALRARLGLRPSAPVVVALLSSPDETRATTLVDAEFHHRADRGDDIAEFVVALRAMAHALPDVDVLLRLHPRLMPNKRESIASPDLARILALLDGLPANAHVNVPGDDVSLYDVIGIASVAVNQSSSAGLEFMALGLPVVNFDRSGPRVYPLDFGASVERGDVDGLAAAVRDAVDAGPRLENAIRAVRWFATVTLRDMLLLSHLVPDVPETLDAPIPDTPSPHAPSAPPSIGAGGFAAAVRRIVPADARERAARWLVRRGRPSTIPDAADDAWWQAEWLERVDSLAAGGPVWEPPIHVRGIELPPGEADAAEADAVAGVVADLRRRLGYPT